MSNDSPRSSSTVDVPVWIHGSEKLVTGIAKTTTCDDVIYSLLCNDGVRNADVECLNYVMVERWRKVERPVSGRAKLAKVWRAWGPEAVNVKLYVKQTDVPSASQVKSKQRHHRHKRRHNENEFFDPEKVRAEKTRLQTIEDMVQLIGEQQRKLKEQVDRITETDREIENIENDVHLNRLKERGSNYVQDSLFLTTSDDSSGLEDMNVALNATDFETYLDLCDKVLDLDKQISVHRNESERLENCIKIQENSKHSDDSSDALNEVKELKGRVDKVGCSNEKLDREIYRVRTQITDRDILIRRKQDYVDKLVRELAEYEQREKLLQSSPDSGKGSSPERRAGKQVTFNLPVRTGDENTKKTSLSYQITAFPVLEVGGTKPLSHAYSCGDLDRIAKTSCIFKYHDSDSNSDTGLSSLHSDEQQVVLETLV